MTLLTACDHSTDMVQMLHETLMHPGVDAMRRTTAEGCYADKIPVTGSDITKWVRAGQCTACAVGKMVESSHPASIHPRPTNAGHRIEADLFFMRDAITGSQLAFHISVCATTGFARVTQVDDRNQHTIFPAVADDINFWKERNHPVRVFRCDNEGAYGTYKNYFREMGIDFQAVPAGNHAHVVENKIGSLKRKIMAAQQGLPFLVPKALMPLLVKHVVFMDNLTVNGKTSPVTPFEKVYGEKPSKRQFVTVPWGSCVAVHEPDLNQQRRQGAPAELGMMVGLDDGFSGAIKVFSFARRSCLVRKTYTQVKPQLEMFYQAYPEARKQLVICERAEESDVARGPSTSAGDVMQPSVYNAEAHVVSDVSENERTQRADDTCGAAASAKPGAASERPANESVVIMNESEEVNGSPKKRVSGRVKRQVRRQRKEEKDRKLAALDTIGMVSTEEGVRAAKAAAYELKGRPRKRRRNGAGDPNVRPSKITHVTRSGRLSKTGRLLEYLSFMSINAGTRVLGEARVAEALYDEILQISEREALGFIKAANITSEMRKKSVNGIGLVDEKSEGRVKARFVANGKRQHDVEEAMMTSPTANVTTIKTVLGLAAKEGRKVQVWDVKGAYLHAFRNPESADVYIWIPATVAKVFRRINPSLGDEYTTADGGLFAKVLKALYGLKESSRDWHLELSDTLMGLGFRRSNVDKCLFIKGSGRSRIEIVIHVDDLLVTSCTFEDADVLKEGLEARYGELKVQRGTRRKYLGMWVVDTERGYRLEQGAMVRELLQQHTDLDVRSAVTPATAKLFNCRHKGKQVDAHVFLSRVMRLMYIARMTRPDILLTVSFLASRVQGPTVEDEHKLRRVMNYLKDTLDLGVELTQTDGEIELRAFTDASYMSHEQGYGHTGNFIEMTGVGMVHCRSAKQSVVTKSSTEAEAVAMAVAEDDLHMVQELLRELIGRVPVSVIFTDSEPLLKLLRQEFLCRGRSKYIDQNFFSIRDRVKNGDYKIEFVSGSKNVADILSKPIIGNRFRYYRGMLMMNGNTSVTEVCHDMNLLPSNTCIGA